MLITAVLIPTLMCWANKSFVLQLPENGTMVSKHVGVLVIVRNCILPSSFVY